MQTGKGIQVKRHAYKIINGKYRGIIDVDMNKLRNKLLLLDISIAGQRFFVKPLTETLLIYLQKDIIQKEVI